MVKWPGKNEATFQQVASDEVLCRQGQRWKNQDHDFNLVYELGQAREKHRHEKYKYARAL